jgi:WD40 repeat protein
VSYLALTPDNRQMLTASGVEGIVHLWDTQAGKIVKSFDLPDHCYYVALSPDGLTLARQSAPHTITIEPVSGGPAIKLNFPENDELCAVAFSPDGAHFFAATFGFASELSMNHVVHLLSYDVAAGFKAAANTTQAANRCTALAVSSDSKQLVFGDQDGRVWAASAPDLKTARPILLTKGMGICSGGIAFSPDGKVLVVGSFDEAIHVFDAHTFEPIQQRIGHSGRVKSVYFSNDGKTLRSLGADNVVCLWDAASAQMKDRFSLPNGTTCVSVRGPDGRYALCASALDVETPFWDQKKKVPPVKVVDLSTGRIISEVDLPVNWSFTASGVLWLREPEALCLADGTSRRFNYLTGELIEKRSVDIEKENHLYNGAAYVADDGKTLYAIGGGYRARGVTLEKSEVDTGQTSRIGESELPHVTGNSRGLVPGNKYFFISDPGMYIYDLTSVKLAGQKRMKGLDLLCVSFSPRGSYYAVAAGARREVGANLTIYEPSVQTEIRVQETLTGKTIFAFPAHSRWVKDIRFSPDEKQLAAVTDDGFIEIWKLNSAKP